jgi:hypothetical protein
MYFNALTASGWSKELYPSKASKKYDALHPHYSSQSRSRKK